MKTESYDQLMGWRTVSVIIVKLIFSGESVANN